MAAILVATVALPAGAIASNGYFETHTEAIGAGLSLTGISCVPGTTTCVAADSHGDAHYTTAASATAAASWTSWSGFGPAPGGGTECPGTELCVMVAGEVAGGGGNLYYATSLGGSFSTAILPTHGVDAVSCSSASFCATAQASSGFISWSSSPAGIKWRAVQIGSGAMKGISCLSSSFCAVVDDSGHVHVATTETGVKEASGWTESDIDGTTPLRAIACTSRESCLAVDGSGTVLTLAIDPDGEATATGADLEGAAELTDIDCEATTCGASGAEGAVFASTDAGASWALRYAGEASLTAVSCASATLCAASATDGLVTTFNPATTVPPLRIDTTSLPTGRAGSTYEVQAGADGGEPPYEWTAAGLPPGLRIEPTTGLIYGTPITATCAIAPCWQPPAVFTPTITVTDADGTEASVTPTLTLAGGPAEVTVIVAGEGAGEVSSDPPGINGCGVTEDFCEVPFEDGSDVTLTAKAAPGSFFEGWEGQVCSGTGTCRIAFNPEPVLLVVARFGKSAAVMKEEVGPANPPSPPRTRITKVKLSLPGTAVFHFAARGKARSFRCALAGPGLGKARFRPCASPRTYRHLKPGSYRFSVVATGPGGTDPTTAKHRFRIAG